VESLKVESLKVESGKFESGKLKVESWKVGKLESEKYSAHRAAVTPQLPSPFFGGGLGRGIVNRERV
jgi:hypothetical protein